MLKKKSSCQKSFMFLSKKCDAFELSRLSAPDSLSSLNGFCNAQMEGLVILFKIIIKNQSSIWLFYAVKNSLK